MAVIDVTTFNGEHELFEIRYNALKNFVDEFRVIEFDRTFSGKKKERKFVNHYGPQVVDYFVGKEAWSKYENLAWQSPNTLGAEHWKTEFMQKESIKDCLTDLNDNDIVYIGDVDEIWQPFPVGDNSIFKLKLRVYTYWLNSKSSEEFWGTIVARYGNIKDKCLNHIRSTYHSKTHTEWGWHFTSMGGSDKVKEKLMDSYTEETYANQQVIDNLYKNIEDNRDFLGRNFVYLKDESEWPQYLKDNREKYKHLLK